MGLTNFQKFKILMFSLILLSLALFNAQAHAAPLAKPLLLEKLQIWQSEIQDRTDLEPFEKDLQIQFVGRLVFQVASKYKEEDLSVFLQKTLGDMQETDNFGYFIDALKEDLATLLEKNEDPISFMQAFIDFSTIRNPALPGEFAEVRSYYDGRQMMQAQTMTLDEAANWYDQKESAAAQYKSDWIETPKNLNDEYKEILPEPSTKEQEEDLLAI